MWPTFQEIQGKQKSSVFCYMTQYGPLQGPYHLHLQGWTVRQQETNMKQTAIRAKTKSTEFT
jgi:hypothetical protein